jgi:porin
MNARRLYRRTALGLTLAVLAAGQAHAAPPPLSIPLSTQYNADGTPAYTGFLGNLQRSNYLLGDMFGLRSLLSQYGISLAVQETSEVLGNPAGGVHQGLAYDGLTQAILQLDTQRAFGLYGGLFNVSALQIHGRNLSADDLDSLQTSSGIESDRSTRLWELWYDQKFLPEDRLDIKIGQQSIDQEFIVNPNGAVFLNTMFGWPLVPSVDLPGGGPAYPLSDLGIRFRYRPINPLAILFGVFNGNPSPTNQGDPQRADASGTRFPTNGGVLALLEFQWSYPAVGAMEEPGQGPPLGHTYKIGAWYNSEKFDDLRFDNQGMSLASPNSNFIPRQHSGDFSLYAVADQMLWRKPTDPNRSVSIFGRVMGTPQSNRNLADLSLNAGLVYHEPFANRADDTVGLGMGYAHISSVAAAYDKDVAAFNPTGFNPIRSTETYVEATYQYQVHPWWQIQPDIQYVFNPGGGIANPNNPTTKIGDELVLGIRTNVLF